MCIFLAHKAYILNICGVALGLLAALSCNSQGGHLVVDLQALCGGFTRVCLAFISNFCASLQAGEAAFGCASPLGEARGRGLRGLRGLRAEGAEG